MNQTSKQTYDFVDDLMKIITKHEKNMDHTAMATLSMQCTTTMIFSRAKTGVDAIVILEDILLACIKAQLKTEDKYDTR